MEKAHRYPLLIVLCLLLSATSLYAEKNIEGFWKTVDDESGRAKSVVALYTRGDLLYGRVLMIFDEAGEVEDHLYSQRLRSPYLEGEPAFCGLDIIWDMEYHERKDRWQGGRILDPGDDKEDEPSKYGCSIWTEGDDLIVRGKIAFLGRNQRWLPFRVEDFPEDVPVPDYTGFRPRIPEIR